MRKLFHSALMVVVFTLAAGQAWAMPPAINEAVLKDYTPAIWHRGLETAYEGVDVSKLKKFVVIEQGGVPAERARHFITWSDYDYRGSVIHVDDGDRISTRRGRPYTYLQRGDIMAVAGIKYYRTTVYLKLISADVYVPRNRQLDKRHSRVTVMLGFKFPGDVIKGDDAKAVMAEIGSWLRPFSNLEEAKAYASGLRDEKAYLAEGEGATAEVPSAPAGAETPQDAKVKSLEEKIERARRDLDEAERELKTMKESK